MSRFVGETLLAQVAVWPLALGLVLAVSAGALELHDWLRLPREAANLRLSMWLLLADLATLSLIGGSLWLRFSGTGSPVQLALLGFGAAVLVGLARDALGVRATHLRVVPPAERAPRAEPKATTPR